jgi:hypothetical protein
MTASVEVTVERGKKKTFVSAVDWPGWSRGGRDETSALEALLAYRDRYGTVVGRAGLSVPALASVDGFAVTERVPGDASTDFGMPAVPGAVDERPVTEDDLDRLLAILDSCWGAFDDTSRRAEGTELRKGPRGGGRDLAPIAAHVVGGEIAYLAALGSRFREGSEDTAREWLALRERVRPALTSAVRGEPLPEPRTAKRPWTPRYFVRRAAWHVLDHVWEIEDRAGLAP